MNQTRLHRRVGSNQHKDREDRYLGLRFKTHLSIYGILLFLSPVVYFGNQAAMSKPVHLISPLATRAYAMESNPIKEKDPELAPLTERDNNIRIIKKVWKKDWRVGVAIATCESGLRSTAYNGSNKNGTWDAGLFQINKIHGWEKDELFDPVANAGIAYSKFVDQGTQPWYSSKHCWINKL